jgi:hypothetical protein
MHAIAKKTLRRLGASGLFLLLVLLAFGVVRWQQVWAANPGSGAIGPTLGSMVTYSGTATGTGAATESVCQEAITCDTFSLTVNGAQTDWAGKLIDVKITWTISANDYDLYIHQGTDSGPIVGSSTGGAPETSEEAVIDPSSTGTGLYSIHTTYFATTPGVDQYKGTLKVIPKPAPGTAIYLKGGIQFSPNVTDKAPVATRDGEPSNRTDNEGNFYVAGIRGTPGGVDLWYNDLQPGSPTYDPLLRNPIYRCQPDAITGQVPKPFCSLQVGAAGGGDVDLAVSRPDPTGFNNNPATLAFSSLVLPNISVGKSADRGKTFMQNFVGNTTGGAPGDDRQWMEFDGTGSVYLYYRTAAPAVTQIQLSNNGGLTYGPATTAGAIGQTGGIAVDQKDGTVYLSGSTGNVCAATPSSRHIAPPLTTDFTCKIAASDPNGVAHIFFPVRVGGDGTAYIAYSNDHDIFLAHSTDKGQSWSPPVRVSDGPNTKTSVFPHLEAGKNPGSVGIVWYGTSDSTNDDNANWKVFYALTLNALDATPTFRQVEASDHYIHGSNISEGGLTGTANRNLLDYFQISFDTRGAAVIGYTDDHSDFDGHTYVTHQVSGPGINGSSVYGATQGPQVPEPPDPPEDGAQVTDFPHDVADALLVVTPTNDPLDILSIKYASAATASGPKIIATMRVSDLSAVPPESTWRMNFTANAPFTGVSHTGSQSGIPGNPYNEYSFALSDRGDQFYVKATTTTGTPAPSTSFIWGTAVRNSDGSITYTDRGPADEGAIDSTNNTITVAVAASKLNAFVTHGPPIGYGSVLAGLRGSTFLVNPDGKRDIARGGTEFTIPSPQGGGCPGGGAGDDAEGDGSEHGDDGHDGNFHFKATGGCPPSGEMDFTEPDTGKGMRGNVDAVTVSGNTAIITGTGTLLDGTPCHYTAIVLGNANPAIGLERFAISWIASTGAFFHTSGALTSGNILVVAH